ncbi:MAG: VWA domain-containing protein [Planctomycetota bacterium]
MLALLPQAAEQSAASARLVLWGDFALANPLGLVVLPLALVLAWLARARARGRASLAVDVPRSLRQGTAFVPGVLELSAFTCAAIALARPLRLDVSSDQESEGVDIALALDRSSSMRFEDMERGQSRFTVVKEVVGEFAARRMSDRESAADSCALVTFARFPRLVCPFTLDVDALAGFLDKVEMANPELGEDGTAIGVGLAKAVAVLRESDAKSRICVLLTDGENNVDEITPRAAAELAAELGIKVYTIFAARYVFQPDPFRGSWVPTDRPADTRALEEIAELTGGRFYRATDRAELENIYAEIEALEKTPRKERRFEETYDLYPWWLAPALLLFFLGELARATFWRRLA